VLIHGSKVEGMDLLGCSGGDGRLAAAKIRDDELLGCRLEEFDEDVDGVDRPLLDLLSEPCVVGIKQSWLLQKAGS